jgi:signal transduction histidine kinase
MTDGDGASVTQSRPVERRETDTLHAGVDHLEDGVLFARVDGLVLFANQRMEMLLGGPAGDAKRKHLNDIATDNPLRHMMLHALETAGASRNVKIAIATDGAPLELLASVFPVSHDGSVCTGAILVVRDLQSVTVSVRTLQSLTQDSAQLAALGQTASKVAHDVRNPLHAMVVRAAFLRERIPDPSPDVVRSLDVLEAEIQRVAGAVDRFMEIVYPSEPAWQPVDLNSVLQELVTLLETEWRAKGVVLSVHLTMDLPVGKGDEQMLRRAFMNLMVNACQSTSRGGCVTISTEAETETLLKVTIADEGVGIPAADVERVFKMYYTTRPEGTGIGLALVRRVVDLHRGSIEILSTTGRGTTVIVRLPIVTT